MFKKAQPTQAIIYKAGKHFWTGMIHMHVIRSKKLPNFMLHEYFYEIGSLTGKAANIGCSLDS